MTSKEESNVTRRALQAKIKRLEFEQLCLERQLKSLEQEIEKQLSNNELSTPHLETTLPNKINK